MAKPERAYAQRHANAKGDHQEARICTAGLRMRRDAKRDLARARRRYDRSLCVVP